MKTINISKIRQLATRGDIYCRWSRGPLLDRKQGQSRDYITSKLHVGLSAIHVSDWGDDTERRLAEYAFLQLKDPDIFGWIFLGQQVGIDSDNGPVVRIKRVLGKLPARN